MDFNQIAGHEKTIEILKRAIRNRAVSHSYLFEGEEGIGKKKVAYAFSKALLCKEEGDEPCNKCNSCIKFDRSNHPDFFLIEPEKDLIRRAEIQKIVGEMTTAPFEAARKIFIIDDSHKMNIESKNTILKTLEEPPEFVHIILISSNPNNLLPTILSRVQTIKFSPLKYEEIERVLMKEFGKTETQAQFIASFTKGAMGKSMEIANDKEFFARREEILSILDSLIRGDRTKAFSSFSFFEDNKDKVDEILDQIIYWFRDLMVYRSLGNTKRLINRDKEEKLYSQSHMEFDKISDIIENVVETKANLRRNINYQLAIETMLLNI